MADMTQIYYDQTSDVLYLSLGEPREAISREIGNDVLLRVDPETGEVVGLTVLNLSARFGDVSQPQTLPIQVTLEPIP